MFLAAFGEQLAKTRKASYANLDMYTVNNDFINCLIYRAIVWVCKDILSLNYKEYWTYVYMHTYKLYIYMMYTLYCMEDDIYVIILPVFKQAFLFWLGLSNCMCVSSV